MHTQSNKAGVWLLVHDRSNDQSLLQRTSSEEWGRRWVALRRAVIGMGEQETYPDSVHVLHAHVAKVEHVVRRPRGRLRGPLRHRGRPR